MSVLTEIRDYARKAKNTVYEWIGVKKAENDNNNHKVKSVDNLTPVIVQKNPGKNVDEFVKVQSGERVNETKNLTQGKSIGYVEELFKNVCNAAGADFVKIKELLNGKNKAFDNLSDDEKIQKYEEIIAALGLVRQMKAEGRFNKRTDVNVWAVKSAELQNETSELKPSELFYKNLELTKAYENEIKEAKSNIDVLKTAYSKRAEIFKSYFTEIAKITKSKEIPALEKLSLISNLQKERSALMKNMYLSLTATIGDNDKLFFASRTVDSKDAHNAIRTARETRLGQQAKTAFSDNITFKKMSAIVKSYAAEVGQAFDRESIRNFNTEITVGMSAHALKQYQQSYTDTRTAHENGTSQTEELDGLYAGIAEGIGAGATLNMNFSSVEEKMEFLKQWEEDAAKFSDYEQVIAGRKQAVEEYIQKYGQGDVELIKHIEEIEKKFDIIVQQKKAERKETPQKGTKETEIIEKKRIETENKNKKVSSNPIESKKVKYNTDSSSIKSHSGTIAITTDSTLSLGTSSVSGSTQENGEKHSNVTSSTEIIQTILNEGYGAAPEGKRLILTLTNPLLDRIADTDEKVNQDIRNVSDAEYFRPAMFGKAKVRQRILKYANPTIQKDLYTMVEGKVGYDFDIINKDKYSKDNEER